MNYVFALSNEIFVVHGKNEQRLSTVMLWNIFTLPCYTTKLYKVLFWNIDGLKMELLDIRSRHDKGYVNITIDYWTLIFLCRRNIEAPQMSQCKPGFNLFTETLVRIPVPMVRSFCLTGRLCLTSQYGSFVINGVILHSFNVIFFAANKAEHFVFFLSTHQRQQVPLTKWFYWNSNAVSHFFNGKSFISAQKWQENKSWWEVCKVFWSYI